MGQGHKYALELAIINLNQFVEFDLSGRVAICKASASSVCLFLTKQALIVLYFYLIVRHIQF